MEPWNLSGMLRDSYLDKETESFRVHTFIERCGHLQTSLSTEQTPKVGLMGKASELGRMARSLSLKNLVEWRSHSAVSRTQFHDWRRST